MGILRNVFALSEQGEKGLLKSILFSVLANISLMLPVVLTVFLLKELIGPVTGSAAAAAVAPSLGRYIGLTALVLAVIFILHWLQYHFVYTATYAESATRRTALAEKLRKLPLSFFGQRDLSDLTTTIMTDCTALEYAFSHYIPQLFGACISTVLIGIGLWRMDWRMALALLWAVPAAILAVAGSKWLQDRFGRRHIHAKLACADAIQECLETIREIKACNQDERYLADLDAKLARAETAAIRTEVVAGSFVSASNMVLRLGMVSVILVGGKLLATGRADLMTYLVFLMAASRVYDPLSAVLTNLAAAFYARLQIERTQQIENQPVQQGSESYAPNGYDICFDHVSFAYDDSETVLTDVSFTARQGQVTALVGPSGGGKSTIAKLAARFWDVDGGRITLGGVDVGTVEPEALLKSFSIVFQDVVLFNDTIMENIRLGKRGAMDEEVLAAAQAAQCDSFACELPQGYLTVIGENGARLSGGERQRISIARALLKDAPVILLDEATASLDAESETQVQAAISRLVRNKTVLVIAHRMRTVAGADKIVVLENGRVAQQGTPAELTAEGGLYRRMVELQRESAQWALPVGVSS